MQKNPNQEITAVLGDVALAVVGRFDMDTVLNQILSTTMKTLNAEVCSIFLEDKEEEPGVLKCVAGSGSAERIAGTAEYKIGEGLTGTVAKTGRSYNIRSKKELQEEVAKGRWKGKYDKLQWPSGESEFRNLLALPLKIKDQVLGVIKVENKIQEYGKSFSNEDLRIFEIIANVISLAIQNARLHRKAEAQSKIITTTLLRVADEVVGYFDMSELLTRIINITMKALHAEVCSIFLEDKEKDPGIIKCVAGSGFAKKIVGIAEYEIGEGFTGTVAKEGKPYNIKNLHQLEELKKVGKWKAKFDPLQWQGGENKCRNLLALPLKIKEQTFGVIKVENKNENYGDYFTEEDLTIFQTITNVIALSIENAKLNKQTEEQSKTIAAVLTEVTNAVVGHFDMERLLDQIINTTMKTLNAEVCSIFLEDKENCPGIIKCVAGSGYAKKIVGLAKYKIGEGFTGAIAESGKSIIIKSQREKDELLKKGIWLGKYDNVQWEKDEREFRNLIALPLLSDNQIIGVIKVENKKVSFGDSFSDEDLTILKTIANVIAPTIERTKRELENIITRTIEFSPEHHQAGVSILNYFGTILKQKYPKEKIKIRIEQRGSNVSMIIENPSGEVKDKVEGTLEEYGLVVQGKLLPQDIFDNEIDVLKLQNELTHTMAILETERRLVQFAEKRVNELEEDVKWLRFQVGRILSCSDNSQKQRVFICYAHEDKDTALRLYKDLKNAGFIPWIDINEILPGQKWRKEIEKAIERCNFFIFLISNHSLNKNGFLQKELKQALDILEETPQNYIFIIPVRLEDAKPQDKKINEIQWVDMFSDWNEGVKIISHTMQYETDKPSSET